MSEPALFGGVVAAGADRSLSEVPSEDLRDDVLQSHYARVQQVLMASVDRQVAEIETSLDAKDRELHRVREEKTELGVGLYKAKGEVDRLNATLYGVKGHLQRTEGEMRCLEQEREVAEGEIRAFTEQMGKLETELDLMRKKNKDSTLKIDRLGEINVAYNSGIKIHRRIEAKLKKEVEAANDRRRLTEYELEKERKNSEKLVEAKKDLELVLTAQKHEVLMANQSMAKMHQEVSTLTEAKKKVEKQWEDAFSAMTKRDQAFGTVQDYQENLKKQLMEAHNGNRVLKIEREEADKKLKEKELECQALQTQLQFLRANMGSLDIKQKETRNALVEAQVAESLYKQELDRVSKHHSSARHELEGKNRTVTELRTKIDKMKREFDDKLRNELQIQIARKEEAAINAARSEISHVVKSEAGKNIDVRHENAQLHMRIHNLEETLRIANIDKGIIKKGYDEVNGHYIQLYEEAKHLMYDLERKEHDVNYLKATIQELNEVDKTRPFQMAVGKLQKELLAAKVENDRMQNMWLESQKDNLKSKDEIAKLTKELVFVNVCICEAIPKVQIDFDVQTQLGITDTIKSTTGRDIEKAQHEVLEQKMEASKLYNELRKLQPLVEEYRQKMNASNMLTTLIRKHEADKRVASRDQNFDRNKHTTVERKYILAKEQNEKLREERDRLRRTNFDLNRKADEMERRYFDSQIMSRRLSEQAGRTVGEITTRLASSATKKRANAESPDICAHPILPTSQNSLAALVPIKLPPPVWASMGSTPGGPMTHTGPPPTAINMDASTNSDLMSEKSNSSSGRSRANHELPDFTSWKLKIESLTCEREFLLNENRLFKSNADELAYKIAKLEKTVIDLQQRIKGYDREQKGVQNDFKTLNARLLRAEKIAASIERQFKVASVVWL
ncbi:hypothetical protein HK101_009566 [Irineochytrium annulatum]|nr:hypothetical protein HK101_009566 [Irineochytrium annulatum]